MKWGRNNSDELPSRLTEERYLMDFFIDIIYNLAKLLYNIVKPMKWSAKTTDFPSLTIIKLVQHKAVMIMHQIGVHKQFSWRMFAKN